MALTLVTALTGCTTGHRIALTYEAAPAQTAQPIPLGRIYVAPVDDLRQEPDLVGEISHGLFESMVRSDTEIRLRGETAEDWVRAALVKELNARGYQIATDAEGSDWQVHGTILEMSYHDGGWILTRPGAMMTVACRLVHDGQLMLDDQYWTSYSVKVPEGQTGDPVHMYEVVLRCILKDLFEDWLAVQQDLDEKESHSTP